MWGSYSLCTHWKLTAILRFPFLFRFEKAFLREPFCFCFKLTYLLCNVQTIAGAIVVAVILHVGDHIACDFPRIVRATEYDYNRYLFHYFQHKQPTYFDLVKGPEGITGILMIILMAISFTLATRWFRRNLVKLPKPFDRLTGFNAFWYSHHLFIIVYVLLVLHGIFLYFAKPWYVHTVSL